MRPSEVFEMFKNRRVVFITNPQRTEYSFSNGKLKVWKEEISYKELLGVIFLEKPEKTPKVRKIPLIIPPLELKNIKTTQYKDSDTFLILKAICEYVGKYLQVYLKRYLGNRDPLGFSKLKRTFWGYKRRYRENHVFMEHFADCSKDQSPELVRAKLSYYGSVYSPSRGLYGTLVVYLGTLVAHHLGLKIPSDKELLAYIFLPAAYAMVNMLEIKQEIFKLHNYATIPPRGQVYTFINEFLNNEAFHEHFIYSLNLLK